VDKVYSIIAGDAAITTLDPKVSATFLGADGKALANTKVTFNAINNIFGTSTYTPTTDSNGVATISLDSTGSYNVTAINPITNEEKEFKVTVSRADSTTSLTAVQNGKSVTLTAALTPNSATGSVTFYIGDEYYKTDVQMEKLL
jgi:hypothetical protein